MASIPTGTVTFLFTDIEGSTRLAREHPKAWQTARDRHHAILRQAIEAHQGFIFQVIGDAFCCAFGRVVNALKAAKFAQLQLQAEPWGLVPIRVRMGIHTGEAEWDDHDYQGYLCLSQVQRLMSAGHGGQILISHSTENLLRGQLPDHTSLLDLGEHKFKDFAIPMHIFQVSAPDLPAGFPPLRALDVFPNNLPIQLTSFVGREKEISAIRKLLHDTHMLTLIGPGGTGKTRLSIQTASTVLTQFPDGVWLVELAPILDPLLVPRTTAVAIGLVDEPQRPVIDMLCEYLREKNLLILLDNCEHLVNASAQMAERILHAAPEVRILASSREALGIAGEVSYRVPSLNLPDPARLPDLGSLSQYEAVRLFIDRAASALSTFTVTNANAPFLAQICHRLDGIPLAIELAAAKVRVLSLEQIARKLDDRFRLLTGGSRTALERHQTLRAAIDWSYNLLPPAEQRLFRHLTVFVGGWTLEAAEAVCSCDQDRAEDILDLLEHLINKSIVISEESAHESRYHMLETMRQYASEKLVELGEIQTLRDRHLNYYLELAETASPHLRRADQVEWFPRLQAEIENLRLALEWASGLDQPGPLLRMASSLGAFWHYQMYWMEGKKWLQKALEKTSNKELARDIPAKALALAELAIIDEQLDDIDEMRTSAQESLILFESIGDEPGLALAQAVLAFALIRRDGHEAAEKLLVKSLATFRRLNDPWGQAFGLLQLDTIYSPKPNHDLWRKTLLELNDIATISGDRYYIAEACKSMANWFFRNNQYLQAEACLDEAEHSFSELGNQHDFLSASAIRVNILIFRGDLEPAKALCQKAERQFELLGEKNLRSFFLWCSSDIALIEQDFNTAVSSLEKILELGQSVHNAELHAHLLGDLGEAYCFQGNQQLAKEALSKCLVILEGVQPKGEFTLETICAFAHAFLDKDSQSAVRMLGAAETMSNLIIINFPQHLFYLNTTREAARALLGDQVFEPDWKIGLGMSVEQALDLARKLVEAM